MKNRNLLVLSIANFFVAASMTMVVPFLSLYIDTFGNFTDAYVQKWAGIIFAVTFLIAFVMSPFWGRFGDKFGRKRILIITGFGISIFIFLMGLVKSIAGLFILRMLMGAVTGFIPTGTALIASQTRKEEAGRVLATLQMGTVSGGLIGPLLGGLLADTFGFVYTFIITSTVIFMATLLVIFGINEVAVKEGIRKKQKQYSRKDVVEMIVKSPMLIMVMFVSFIVQTANFSIQPQLALYVHELLKMENVAFLAGFAFSITGLGNLLATRAWGILGDRIGYEKVLLSCLILGGLFFLPQGFVTSIWQLVILRFLYGMVIGGIIPSVTAYIRQAAPLSVQGEVLGYNQSFRFLGNVIGPVVGGFISSYWSISSVFYFSASLFFVAVISLSIMIKRNRKEVMREERLTGT